MKLVDNFLKSFIFSYYLPASIFVITNYFLIALFFSKGNASSAMDAIGEAVVLDRILLILLLSGFISYGFRSSDYQLIRLFEGYTFRPFLGVLTLLKKRKRGFWIERLKHSETSFGRSGTLQ